MSTTTSENRESMCKDDNIESKVYNKDYINNKQ